MLGAMGSEKRTRPVPAEEETDGGGSGPPAKRARVSSSLHRANEPSRVSEVKLWVNKGSVQVPRSSTALQSIEPARQQVYQRPGVPPPTDLGSFVVPDRFSPPSRPDDSVSRACISRQVSLLTQGPFRQASVGTAGRPLCLPAGREHLFSM